MDKDPKKLGSSSFVKEGPYVLKSKQGGGCLMLFGLPFFLVGLFVMQAPLNLINADLEGGAPPWYVALPFGLVFASVGAGLMFGRSGIIIDIQQDRLIKWWGLLVPMKRKEYILDTLSRLTLKKEVRKNDKSTQIVYPIRLESSDQSEGITLEEPGAYPEARELAEDLAKFLDRPLTDYTSGSAVTRDPDRLDETVREKLQREGEEIYVPPAPMDMKTRVEETGDGLALEIPSTGIDRFAYMRLVIPLIVAIVVGTQFLPKFWELPGPSFIRYFFVGFVGLIFVLGGVLHVLKQAKKSTRVTLNTWALSVEQRALRKSKTTEIPLSELEDLVFSSARSAMADMQFPGQRAYPNMGETGVVRMPDGRPAPRILMSLIKMAGGSSSIVARSDKEEVRFGQGLSDEELTYLHALLKKRLAQ